MAIEVISIFRYNGKDYGTFDEAVCELKKDYPNLVDDNLESASVLIEELVIEIEN